MPLSNALTVSARYTDDRGEYMMVIAAELGPCGACQLDTSCFITRNGRTVCVPCDVLEEAKWRSGRQQKQN